MRAAWRPALVGALLLVMVASLTGAQASTPSAQGVINGHATLQEPGMPVLPGEPCYGPNKKYTFDELAITGEFSTGTRTYIGPVTVSGTGDGGTVEGKNSICETGEEGKGTIQSAPNTLPGPGAVTGTSNVNGSDKLWGRFWGSYTRNGPQTTATVTTKFCIGANPNSVNCPGSPGERTLTLNIDLSLFLPDRFDETTLRVTGAS